MPSIHLTSGHLTNHCAKSCWIVVFKVFFGAAWYQTGMRGVDFRQCLMSKHELWRVLTP